MLPFYCWILLSLSAKISVRARTIKLCWLLLRWWCRVFSSCFCCLFSMVLCHFRQISMMAFVLHIFFFAFLFFFHAISFLLLLIPSLDLLVHFTTFSKERAYFMNFICRLYFYYMNSMRLGKHMAASSSFIGKKGLAYWMYKCECECTPPFFPYLYAHLAGVSWCVEKWLLSECRARTFSTLWLLLY